MEGTLNVLRSCKKNPYLRRVVLTSSSSTVRVRDDFDPNMPLDESSWSSMELCERLQVSFYRYKRKKCIFVQFFINNMEKLAFLYSCIIIEILEDLVRTIKNLS